MLAKVAGYKTYVVCVVSLLYAGWGLYRGDIDFNKAFDIVQVALTGAGLRSAMTLEVNKTGA
jgi:hypothetical protein